MRRFLGAAAIAVLVLAAAAMAAPEDPALPDIAVPDLLNVAAGSSNTVWHCAWVDSGAIRDSDYAIATLTGIDAVITLPTPIPGQEADRAQISVSGPGAERFDVADLVRRGAAPGFIEFNDGPATAATVVMAETLLTGDRCIASAPKLWHLPGGTTRVGRQTTVRLFNPFPDLAKADIQVSSEFGSVSPPELQSIDVSGRSWVDIELNPILPFLDEMSLTVSTEEGLVIPWLALAGSGDEASWPASRLSTAWYFPLMSDVGLVPSLVIANPGGLDAAVQIEFYATTGPQPAAASVVVAPGFSRRVEFTDLDPGEFGLRLTSDQPVSAAVVAETPVVDETPGTQEPGEGEADPGGVEMIAGTLGIAEPARRWLLPGAGSVVGSSSSIWLLNAEAQPVTVTVTPLGAGQLSADKVRVEAFSVRRIRLPAESFQVSGYLVEAIEPITVAWNATGDRGAMFVAGVSVRE